MASPDAIVFRLNGGLNNGGGFFSVFFFMCNAYLHARSLGLPFYIEHDRWPYTYNEGWHDYFLSLRVKPAFLHYKNIIKSAHMSQNVHPHFSMKEYADCIRDIFIVRPDLRYRINRVRQQLGSEYTAVFVRRVFDHVTHAGDALSWREHRLRAAHVGAHPARMEGHASGALRAKSVRCVDQHGVQCGDRKSVV